MSRFSNPFLYAHDGNGLPLSGAKLNFFSPGTTTPKTIYTDNALSIPATNPQIANASGDFDGNIFLDGLYDLRLDTADDIVVYSLSNIGELTNTQFEVWVSTTTYGIADLVRGSDNNYYRSLVGSNIGNNPTSSPAQWALQTFINAGVVNVETSFNNTVKFSKGADIASASALATGTDGNYFDVTGTTQINAINTRKIGTVIKLHFDSVVVLAHSASLVLPKSENITTGAGDEAEFMEYATGQWRLTNYQREDQNIYSEGTFTPTLQDDSLSDGEGQAYVTANTFGNYTKIGRLVHFALSIQMSSLGTLAGANGAKIANLPFTALNISGRDNPVTVGRATGLAITANQAVAAYVVANTTRINLQLWDLATGTGDLTVTEVSADGLLLVAGTYIASG